MDADQNEMSSFKKRLDDLEKIVKSGRNKVSLILTMYILYFSVLKNLFIRRRQIYQVKV